MKQGTTKTLRVGCIFLVIFLLFCALAHASPLLAPTVTASPSKVTRGQTSILTASTVTGGAPPYTYQWFEKAPTQSAWSQISGATSTSYSFVTTSFTTTGTWTFEIMVTDSIVEQVTSSTTVTVNVVPTVTISPGTASLDVGQSQMFNSTVSGGTPPFTYQWYLNGTLVATSSSWTFTPNSSGSYNIYVNVTDNAGVIKESNISSVTVNPIPSVTVSPSSAVMDVGQSQTFNSAVSGGTSPYTYQWYLNGTLVSGAIGSTWTFTLASAGSSTVYVNVTDGVGAQATSNTATVTTSPQPVSPYWYLILVVVIAAVVVVGLAVYKMLRRPKKPPVPAQLRIIAEPLSIIADGDSKSTITLQLLDKKGNPIPAIADTQVKIVAARGKVENPVVTIAKGKDTEKTVIVSSTQSGQVPVVANAEGLKSISITLNFQERLRYCMHCGAVMPLTTSTCPKCGKAPPAGVDTKVCQNCNSVIPSIAKFCSECGAGQKT